MDLWVCYDLVLGFLGLWMCALSKSELGRESLGSSNFVCGTSSSWNLDPKRRGR